MAAIEDGVVAFDCDGANVAIFPSPFTATNFAWALKLSRPLIISCCARTSCAFKGRGVVVVFGAVVVVVILLVLVVGVDVVVGPTDAVVVDQPNC